ncbi:WG repeat-containing protein [Mycoplasmatota bacterium]|nr:WG repeat-containing protein [Mycoplasmatota bacterium]
MKIRNIVIFMVIVLLFVFGFCWYNKSYRNHYSLYPVSGDIFEFTTTGKRGLINVSNGEVIVSPKYEYLDCMSGKYCITKLSNKWEIIDLNGNILVGPLEEGVDFIYIMSQYVIIRKDQQVSLLDMQGNIVVDYLPLNTYIYSIDSTNQIVYLCNGEQDKYGFINLKDNISVELVYRNKLMFSDKISVAKLGNKYGFINDKNEVVVDFLYDWISSDFHEGLAIVKSYYKYGYIDKMGNVVIDFKYDEAKNFYNGLAIVKNNSKYGYIDKTGNVVIDYQYDEATNFHEGLAVVQYNSKYGYIDKTGNVVIDYQYDSAFNFNYGVALIMLDDYEGFINKNNERIIPIHKSSNDFKYKIIHSTHKKTYYINDDGTVYCKNGSGAYGLTIDGKKIINQKGKVIIDKKFKDIQYINDNMFCIEVGNLECYNMDGEILFAHDKFSYRNYYNFDLGEFDSRNVIFEDYYIYYVYDVNGNFIYKSSLGDKNLLVSKSNNYIVYTKGNKIISYNINSKEKKVIYEKPLYNW